MIKKVLLIILVYGLTSSCGKKKSGDMTFQLLPATLTLLNSKTTSCSDFATGNPTAMSATAAVAMFQKFSITWKNRERDLKIYGMRFTSKDSNFPAPIDIVVSGTDMFAYVLRDPTTFPYCDYCVLHRVTDPAKESRVSTIESQVLVTDPNSGATSTSDKGCAPIIGGITPRPGSPSFTAQFKVTLLGYSKDDAGNIFNEYAQVPLTVRFESEPP